MKRMYQLTSEGKKELENELAELKGRRGAIADKIANARDYGDLSENAEYDAAREEQAQTEGRISEIEDILQNADIIAVKKGGNIGIGSSVSIKNKDKTFNYVIVGPVEADPLNGKISDESPIGVALHGHKKGDHVSIKTPKGEVDYEIVTVG